MLDIAAGLKPSARGELEITDVNRAYLERGQLHVEKLPRGVAWLDTGTHEALMQASNYIQAIEERQGLMVACLEEIAYRMGYITADDLARIADARWASSAYGQYLRDVLEQDADVRVVADRICPECCVIEPDVHRDARGFFLETYHAEQYRALGIPGPSCRTTTRARRRARCAACTCRSRRPQGKLIRVIERRDLRRRGRRPARVADVRPVGRRDAVGRQLPAVLHPAGIRARLQRAQPTSPRSNTSARTFTIPATELGIAWNDPALAIAWASSTPILSARDRAHPPLVGADRSAAALSRDRTVTVTDKAVSRPRASAAKLLIIPREPAGHAACDSIAATPV